MPSIFWVILVIAVLLFIASPFMHQSSQGTSPRISQRSQRRAFEEADRLIATAGSESLSGMHDQAYSHYAKARDIARSNSLYLLEADSLYCMAQIAERRQEYKTAAQLLHQALANRAQWEQEKPNYVRLIENTLKQVEAKIQP